MIHDYSSVKILNIIDINYIKDYFKIKDKINININSIMNLQSAFSIKRNINTQYQYIVDNDVYAFRRRECLDGVKFFKHIKTLGLNYNELLCFNI